LGVVNIRGEILGVLDLRKKLNHPFEAGSGLSMLVVSSEGGSIAAVVDRVQAVAEIPPGEIEKMPLVRTRFPIEYLMGIGKVDGVMVTLIDLKKVLKDEDFKSLSSLSAAA
jgi:purine-binding chemotaxis protein CheW